MTNPTDGKKLNLIGGAQQASQLGTLMQEQRGIRLTAGLPSGNPNCGLPLVGAMRTQSRQDPTDVIERAQTWLAAAVEFVAVCEGIVFALLTYVARWCDE